MLDLDERRTQKTKQKTKTKKETGHEQDEPTVDEYGPRESTVRPGGRRQWTDGHEQEEPTVQRRIPVERAEE